MNVRIPPRSQGRLAALVGLCFALGTSSSAVADGGASVAVATYLKAEAANFARQAAEGWFVSYGPVVNTDGSFAMTFKNEIRYGPGGIGKETWWIDVKGNLEQGSFEVKGRGSDLVAWVDWFYGGIKNSIPSWIAEWKRENQPKGQRSSAGSVAKPTTQKQADPPLHKFNQWVVMYKNNGVTVKDGYAEVDNATWKRVLSETEPVSKQSLIKDEYTLRRLPSKSPNLVRLEDGKYHQVIELDSTAMNIYRINSGNYDKNVYKNGRGDEKIYTRTR